MTPNGPTSPTSRPATPTPTGKHAHPMGLRARFRGNRRRWTVSTAGIVAALAGAAVTVAVTGSATADSQSAHGLPACTVSAQHRLALGVASAEQWAGDRADSTADLPKLCHLGVTDLREDFLWNTIQPDNGAQFHWDGLDSAVGFAADNHERILPIIGYDTKWATPDGNLLTVPRSATAQAAYARFAAAVAVRYGVGGTFWKHRSGPSYPIVAEELWNEPWYSCNTTALNYAKLLHVAGDAVHEVDPSMTTLANVDDRSTVAAGGRWVPWGEQVLRYSGLLRGAVDGWALHPYSTSGITSTQLPVQSSLDQLNWLTGTLARHDMPGHVWITELGFPDKTANGTVTATTADAEASYRILVRRLVLRQGPRRPEHVFLFTSARADQYTKPGSFDYGYTLIDQDGRLTTPFVAAAQTALHMR